MPGSRSGSITSAKSWWISTERSSAAAANRLNPPIQPAADRAGDILLLVGENLKLLLRLLYRPSAAMGDALDRGSLLFASVAVLAATVLLKLAAPWLPFSFYAPLFVLAAFYVPGALLLSTLLARTGDLRRDYSPLLTCAAMGLAAVEVPLAACAWVVPPPAFLAPAALALLYFGVLMFFAVRTVFGTGSGTAAGVVSLSWIPLVAAAFAWGPLRFLLGWLASPFFLFYAWYYLGSELGGLGAGLRARQNYRRMLEAAAINPHDGEAQYQLGLIHQQRGQYGQAIERFRRAVAIDPALTDAHFQLGRIARRQGRLKDALGHFQTVVNQDERHSQSEVLRELGGIYLSVHQYPDARNELAPYIERWPYDPEGLYYYGQALEGLGDRAGAREMYARAVESARTAPRYLRRSVAKWSRLAQKALVSAVPAESAPRLS
jgi:tetratricopeptide (TPR) repeat protein